MKSLYLIAQVDPEKLLEARRSAEIRRAHVALMKVGSAYQSWLEGAGLTVNSGHSWYRFEGARIVSRRDYDAPNHNPFFTHLRVFMTAADAEAFQEEFPHAFVFCVGAHPGALH